MTNAFPQFAASGLAAAFLIPSVAGSVLSLAGIPLFEHLGEDWECTLHAAYVSVVWLLHSPPSYLSIWRVLRGYVSHRSLLDSTGIWYRT